MTETVRDKLAREAYTNKLPYPHGREMSVFYVYDKGSVVVNGLPAVEVDAAMKKDWKDKGYLVDEQKVSDAKLKEARRAYGAENARLMDEFKADVERENDVVGHPKLDKVWALVGEKRSSMNEKVDYFESLVDLIK